jgi:hypothetical protein
MIDNVHMSQVGQSLSKTPLPHPDSPNTRAPGDSDAEVQINSGDILNQARQAEESDADAVRRARELLLSGRLTSPENVHATAENIITFGI